MKKFEYKEADISRFSNGFIRFEMDGIKVEDYGFKKFTLDFLNKVGEKGWELIYLDEETMLFKRESK